MITCQLGYELPLSGLLGCWDTELNLRHWPTFFREHRDVSDLFWKDLRSLKDESTTKRWLESFQSLEVPSLFVTEARKKLMEGPSMPMGFFRGFPECKKMICRKRLETLQGSERHRCFSERFGVFGVLLI